MTNQITNNNAPVAVTVGFGARIFELSLWLMFILPGLLFKLCKLKAENHFHRLEQKIQQYNSQVQNYLEQRVVILKNCAKLVDRAIALDKETYKCIAQYRSGQVLTGEGMTRLNGDLDTLSRSIQATVENYPELGAHQEIREALRQNVYLRKEITSCIDLYNNAVYTWNRDIFQWITNRIVAAELGYTTKPFFETRYAEQEDAFF